MGDIGVDTLLLSAAISPRISRLYLPGAETLLLSAAISPRISRLYLPGAETLLSRPVPYGL